MLKKPNKAKPLKPETESIQIADIDIDRAAERVLKKLRVRLKYFVYGFFGFILVVVFAEMVSKEELIRTWHSRMFPASHLVAISYEATIELREGGKGSNSGHLSFYSTNDQRVKMYAYFNHRFDSDGEPWQIVVAVDNHEVFDEPSDQLLGGFREITDVVGLGRSPTRTDRIHSVSFSLFDGQPIDTMEVVTVECVVLVYGSTD